MHGQGVHGLGIIYVQVNREYTPVSYALSLIAFLALATASFALVTSSVDAVAPASLFASCMTS